MPATNYELGLLAIAGVGAIVTVLMDDGEAAPEAAVPAKPGSGKKGAVLAAFRSAVDEYRRANPAASFREAQTAVSHAWKAAA